MPEAPALDPTSPFFEENGKPRMYVATSEAQQAVGDVVVTFSPNAVRAIPGQTVRPANTTPYDIGDLVGDVIELPHLTRGANDAIRIERVRLRKATPNRSGASFRVHLFRSLPTVTATDNAPFNQGGALSLTSIIGHVGAFSLDMNYSADIGACGVGLPDVGSGVNCQVVNETGSLWAVIEALGAYTPAASEQFVVTVEGAVG